MLDQRQTEMRNLNFDEMQNLINFKFEDIETKPKNDGLGLQSKNTETSQTQGFLEKHNILGLTLLILSMFGFTGSLTLIKYIQRINNELSFYELLVSRLVI